MGGGASALQEMDEIITCTFLLGQAITAMHFPDMYRIQSFHSDKAPPLESDAMQHFRIGSIFGDPDEFERPDQSQNNNAADTSREDFDYEDPNYFVVVVNDERIVLEDVAKPNEDGWTPLHACCHSQATVSAGLAIIEEMKAKGCSFEQKTKRGPGAGNEGWTALHMAAAYGIAPLVVCLIAAGANSNTNNSLDWSPLNEACHRGFIVIARELVTVGKANVKHLPDVEAHRRAPFARPPPQSPLGEASRCGFDDICKLLLESGANTEMSNYVGWTPLHEASFYNHAKVVKILLSFGANACTPNAQGLYPYQLASSPEVKAIIKDVIGEDAIREQEISTTSGEGRSATEKSPEKNPEIKAPAKTPEKLHSPAPMKKSPSLHSGAMLGELPHLASPSMREASLKKERSRKQKDSGSSQKHKSSVPIPENFPKHLLCAICERPLQDPVRSPYGGLFERKAIKTWLQRNGSVCPLTGQPLVETELMDAPEIKAEVAKFFEKPKVQSSAATEEDELYDF